MSKRVNDEEVKKPRLELAKKRKVSDDNKTRKKVRYNEDKKALPLDDVTAFKGSKDILSNFYPCTIHVYEKSFPSSEHAYQYAKALCHGQAKIAQDILKADNAWEGKKLGGKVVIEYLWNYLKVTVMQHIIRSKARCVPAYKQALLSAKSTIVEAVPGEYFWSCGLNKTEALWRNDRSGKNIMGRLHMELRDQLKQQ